MADFSSSAAASALVRATFARATSTSALARGTFVRALAASVLVAGQPAEEQVYGRKDRLVSAEQDLSRRGAREFATYAYWTPAIRCSCRLIDGQVKTTCRVCRGWGWFWLDQDERQIAGEITQATLHREYQVSGVLLPGDLVFAPEKRQQFGVQDRFRLARPDLYHFDVRAESELVVRDSRGGPVDTLRDRIAHLLRVTRADPATGDVTRYRVDIDVTPSGNTLTWDAALPSPHAGTIQPGPGIAYAIDYVADHDWLVVEPPTPRAVSNVGLPTKLLLRRRARDVRLDTKPAFNPGMS